MKVLLVSEGQHELDGALEALVWRLLETHIECQCMTVRDTAVHTHPGKGAGMFKKAVRCILHAHHAGFDAVVLLIDQDDERERHKHFNQAQEYAKVPIRRALGVAIRSFDAWMLADEQALTRVLGIPIQRQPNPESISNPKEICAQFLTLEHAPNLSQSQFYAALMDTAQLQLLEQRCPDGFGPFARRVKALVHR